MRRRGNIMNRGANVLPETIYLGGINAYDTIYAACIANTNSVYCHGKIPQIPSGGSYKVTKYGVSNLVLTTQNVAPMYHWSCNSICVSDSEDMMLVSNGTKLYSYSFSVPGDVSTITQTAMVDIGYKLLSINLVDGGTKLFAANRDYQSNILEFSLSTANDINTIAFVGQYTGVYGSPSFSPIGDKLITYHNGILKEFSLSTTFDLSTATLEDSIDVSGFINNGIYATLNIKDNLMFISAAYNTSAWNDLYKFNLTVPYTLGTFIDNS